MVNTTGGDRAHHVLEAQCIEFGLGQVEVLITPARLFTRHDLAFGKTLLCCPHTFHCQHRTDDPTHVEHSAHLFLGAGALALGVDFFQYLLDHRRLRLGTVLHHHGAITLGTLPYVFEVWLGTRPPGSKHLLTGVTYRLRFLDGGRRHDTPGLQNDVVRLLLAHLQPGGLLLNPRRSNRQHLQRKSVLGCTLLQDRQQLLAERAVVVTHADLLAFEFVHATGFFADVFKQGVASHPIMADQRKVPFEYPAVGRIAAPVARGDQRNLVGWNFFGQCKRDTGGQGLEHRGTAVFAFEPLVTLDPARRVVGGLAFFNQGLDAIDAAAHIDQFHIVVVPVGPGGGVGCYGTGTPGEHRKKLLLGLRQRAGGDDGQQAGQGDIADLHESLLDFRHLRARGLNNKKHGETSRFINAETATGASSACLCSRASPARGARRSGTRRSAHQRPWFPHAICRRLKC